jgi:hypothetical protein
MADKHGVGTFVNEAHELATDALDLFSVPQYEEALVHGKELTYILHQFYCLKAQLNF